MTHLVTDNRPQVALSCRILRYIPQVAQPWMLQSWEQRQPCVRNLLVTPLHQLAQLQNIYHLICTGINTTI